LSVRYLDFLIRVDMATGSAAVFMALRRVGYRVRRSGPDMHALVVVRWRPVRLAVSLQDTARGVKVEATATARSGRDGDSALYRFASATRERTEAVGAEDAGIT